MVGCPRRSAAACLPSGSATIHIVSVQESGDFGVANVTFSGPINGSVFEGNNSFEVDGATVDSALNLSANVLQCTMTDATVVLGNPWSNGATTSPNVSAGSGTVAS